MKYDAHKYELACQPQAGRQGELWVYWRERDAWLVVSGYRPASRHILKTLWWRQLGNLMHVFTPPVVFRSRRVSTCCQKRSQTIRSSGSV
jgi:hypothetical protein